MSSRIAATQGIGFSINDPGAGYALGDVLTVVQSGGSGGTLTVATITGGGGTGPVGTLVLTTPGTGYALATGLSTTVSPAGGSGCKINILSLTYALSLAMLIAAYAQESGEVIMPLLTFDHPDLAEPMRFALNGENIISRTKVFHASYFDVLVPDDTADRPPQANLSFPNVDREMTALLESSIIPPTVLIEIILASDPNNVELEFPGLQLQSGTKYNVQTASGALAGRRTSREGFPKGIICPSYFPGAF